MGLLRSHKRQELRELKLRTVSAFDAPLARAYSRVRFVILRERFLEELGQYLPEEGEVLDVGAGFGLFALFFAQLRPGIHITAVEMNPRRVAAAQRAAAALGVTNVEFRVGRAEDLRFDRPLSGAYTLDLLHHLAPADVAPLVERLTTWLEPGGVLLVKDVETEPAAKRWFTHAMDLLVDPGSPPRYLPRREVVEMLQGFGTSVKVHSMRDLLPYPHVLYVAHKLGA